MFLFIQNLVKPRVRVGFIGFFRIPISEINGLLGTVLLVHAIIKCSSGRLTFVGKLIRYQISMLNFESTNGLILI